MPDDAGGTPFPDGEQPDEHDHGSHGAADEDFASVVFDEAFVRAAQIHEPSAVERLVAAAEARAGLAVGPEHDGGDPYDDPRGPSPYDDDTFAPYGPYGPYGGALRPYRGTAHWHRPVAWVLAVVMGVGLVALAFTAVQRGGGGAAPGRPPASTDAPSGGTAPGRGPARPGLPPPASTGAVPSSEPPRTP
ncbi:SCO2584 family spore wall biosynthesis protein [Streptomyces sp. NPDC002067]